VDGEQGGGAAGGRQDEVGGVKQVDGAGEPLDRDGQVEAVPADGQPAFRQGVLFGRHLRIGPEIGQPGGGGVRGRHQSVVMGRLLGGQGGNQAASVAANAAALF
jgi:hypothetical protein